MDRVEALADVLVIVIVASPELETNRKRSLPFSFFVQTRMVVLPFHSDAAVMMSTVRRL
jgi:hypothetical protein